MPRTLRLVLASSPERLLRPGNVVWAAIATPLFLLALLLLSGHLVGPFEWDGREYEPRPTRAAAEFLPAAVGFVAFVLGVQRRGRAPFVMLWAAASSVWVAVLILQPL